MRRVLGVQKKGIIVDHYNNDSRKGRDSTGVGMGFEVGCFCRKGRFPMVNTWTIVWGRFSANIVRLGTSIASSPMAEPTIMDGQGHILVHSGDPIALLNDWIG